MKEPGELAFDAWRAAYAKIGIPWRMLGDDERAEWAAVESAIRADERAKMGAEIERLKSENIRLREALGEILHAVCSSVLATVEEEKK